MSNNVAEYSGLIEALKWLIVNCYHNEPVRVYGDSQLVIYQMSGEYKIKSGYYTPYALQAQQLVQKFPDIKFSWIPRELNQDADALTR